MTHIWCKWETVQLDRFKQTNVSRLIINITQSKWFPNLKYGFTIMQLMIRLGKCSGLSKVNFP